jgi:hypothetical protein
MSNKELSQLAQLSLSAANDLTCIAECLGCSEEVPLWWTTKLATALAYVAVLKESLSLPEEPEEGEAEENELSEDSLTDSPEEQETEEVEEPEEEDMLPPSYRMVSYAP